MDWKIYSAALSIAYYVQVDTTTGLRPFDSVLSHDVPSLTLESPPEEMLFLLRKNFTLADETLRVDEAAQYYHEKRQVLDKKNFHKCLGNQELYPEAGTFVYFRR